MRFSWICLCCVVCASCARQANDMPDLVSINIIDREGISETFSNRDRLEKYDCVDFLAPQPYQKVLRVYDRNADNTIKAYVTSYHPNGQLKQYLEVCNGRAFGFYREWYETGIMKVEANVIGGMADITTGAEKTWLFEGLSRAWDEGGNLAAEIPYTKGFLQGTSTYFHPSGKVWKKLPYIKNELNGTVEIFLEDGTLLQTFNYCVGQREGCALRYWSLDKVAAQEEFSEGKLIRGVYYSPKGELIAGVDDGKGYRVIFGKAGVAELHEYRNGIPQGEIKIFNRSNRLIRIFHVKNGSKHGEEVIFFEPIGAIHAMQPKMSLPWYEDKIQGIAKTWYDNGAQESQREFSANLKNGLATAWYRDGSIMLLEEYDRDKLMRGEYYRIGEKQPISTISNGKGIATIFDGDGNFLRRINYNEGSASE